ncbi:MAG: type II secretion system F family protein [Dehalococcoidales bacterium]|nr:type II secretion system F family protein [Dehalococcoidales bacterium]
MTYQYVVSTLDKKVLQGQMNADSEEMAEAALQQSGYRVLTLKEARPGISLERLLPTLFGVRPQHVIDLSQQLADLIDSGLNILVALGLLKGQAAKPALERLITGLIEELQAGNPFSEALGKYPEVFSNTYRQVVAVSEQAGNLEDGLRQVAAYMEKQMAIKKKVVRALAYPVLVLVMAVGVMALFVTIVLPPLATLFASFGTELPWTTKIVIAIADFFVNHGTYLLGGVLVIAVLLAGYARLPAGRLTVDRLLLRVPILGPVNIARNISFFCRTTGMLLHAGLPLPQIMSTVIQSCGNEVIRQALQKVKEQLVQGQGLSEPLAANALFPRLMVEMLGVGEQTGNIDSTLETLANLYEQKADRRIDTLTAMIEPVMTIAIGMVVALLALSIIMPMYSVLDSVQ